MHRWMDRWMNGGKIMIVIVMMIQYNLKHDYWWC
jgi:hypothetical protein